MVKIGVISDTHDRLEAIDTALQYFVRQGIETVIHCGDWKSLSSLVYFTERAAELNLKVYGVLGNNDTDVEGFILFAKTMTTHVRLEEGILELNIDDKRIAVYHGHHAPTLRKVRTDDSYDIVCLGHTHKPLIENVDSILLVNPGSTAFSIPRSKTWRPTVAIIDTVTLQADIHFYS
jgi:putative phosphoesterase